MINKCLYILFFAYFSPFIIYAQNTEEKLAQQYFNSKAFDKAVVYYQNLYNSKHKKEFYNKLLSCYIELKEYKNAEKLTKRQHKIDPLDLSVLVDQGQVYIYQEDTKKAKKTFNEAIQLMGINTNQVVQLAAAFIKYGHYEYALKTYDKAQKIYKNYPYNLERAQVYQIMGNYELMIKEYLDLLLINESYVANVQNALQTQLSEEETDPKRQLLKTSLIKYIQKYPDKEVFSEMLIWYYIQEKNFKGAFFQAKALDKRNKEGGRRLINLAQMAMSNKQYDVAIDCYQYIVDQGETATYYTLAKMELVNVYYTKITTGSYTTDDLTQLEKLFESTFEQLGKDLSTIPLIMNYAHLQAFYLHNTGKAIDNLNLIINMPGIERHDRAKAKIELADTYLLSGDVWEASLLYGQVEKEFKYDRLGEIAKFKNAKISFYTGDFSWAKAQLDVLKASTSKLIANDAMQLSILITDNLANDTATEPLVWYAKAELLAFQNKHLDALKTLDSIEQFFPNHDIADDVWFKRYEIYLKQQDFEKAAESLKQIIDTNSESILADDALFKLAELYDFYINDKQKAAELYKQLMFNYKDSIYVIEARKRYRNLINQPDNIHINDGNKILNEN